MGFISNMTGLLGNLWGGKNQFTQTHYQNRRNLLMGKGEIWVDPSLGNLAELVNTTPQLKAVIDRKAAMFSNGVWKHEVNGEELETSDKLDFLNSPNPLCNGNEFLRQYVIAKSIYGNVFINSNNGLISDTPLSMYVLPSKTMSIIQSGKIYKQVDIKGIIEKYRLELPDGKFEDFEVDEILHFMDSNPDNPIIGTSKINALTMPISNIRGAYGFRNRIITNNAALGILSTAATDGMGVTLNPDAQKQIDEGMQSQYGMQDNKMNLLQTEASVSYHPVSYPTKDLLLFEEVDANFKIIIDSYGLNKNIFSPDSDSKFSNMNEGLKMAYQDCIIPEAEDYSIGITKMLGMDGKKERVYLSYDHLAVLQEDENEKASTLKLKAEAIAILNENGREADAKMIEII